MNNLNYLIGMKEDMALKVLDDADIWFRVVRRDSTVAIVTSDLQMDRVNLEIDDSKITKASYG